MSVLIQGVDMPIEELGAITVTIYADGCVENFFSHKKLGIAVPVTTPHGDLKDADAAERNLLKTQIAQKSGCAHGIRKARAILRDLPTIIPKEE